MPGQVLGASLFTTVVAHVQVPATPAVVSAVRVQEIVFPTIALLPAKVHEMDDAPVVAKAEVYEEQRSDEAPASPRVFRMVAVEPEYSVT